MWFMTVPKFRYGNNKHMLNKNNLKTIEAQSVQKRKNDPRPKFSGSYKKNPCILCKQGAILPLHAKLELLSTADMITRTS